jgi:hypothetical protein
LDEKFQNFNKIYFQTSSNMPRRMKKGLDTKKFDECVTKVKKKSGKQANPYAVCNATMSGKNKGKSKNSIKSKSKK